MAFWYGGGPSGILIRFVFEMSLTWCGEVLAGEVDSFFILWKLELHLLLEDKMREYATTVFLWCQSSLIGLSGSWNNELILQAIVWLYPTLFIQMVFVADDILEIKKRFYLTSIIFFVHRESVWWMNWEQIGKPTSPPATSYPVSFGKDMAAMRLVIFI